jgi:hypothetical protein
MSGFSPRGRRGAIALLIAVASLAIGAVFGSAQSGEAAVQAVPANTGTPTISGTAQQGSKLTGSDGTWSNSPTSYTYAWSRCNTNGDSCATIAGATIKDYTLTADDVGHTVRITVTAKNSDGSATATSAPSAVVSDASAPKNTALPKISGTVAIDSVLSVTNGTWTGKPGGYTYAWTRCDKNGNACAKISGADGNQYKLTSADADTTVRAVVTAKNDAGETSATSDQSGLVPEPSQPAPTPQPAPTGCPSGTGAIQVADLSAPARLAIGQQSVSPGVVTPSVRSIQVHVRVTACNGRPVQGALVFASPVPYNQYEGGELATGSDGTVTLTMAQRAGFPATAHQQRLALFIRARKPGEPVLGGISSRRLVTFPVSLR